MFEGFTYNGDMYTIEDGENCKGCEFRAVTGHEFGGCKAPEDFPEKVCPDGQVFKKHKIEHLKGASIEFVDSAKLDQSVIDETLSVWVATRMDGASASMVMSDHCDSYLLDVFDTVAKSRGY